MAERETVALDGVTSSRESSPSNPAANVALVGDVAVSELYTLSEDEEECFLDWLFGLRPMLGEDDVGFGESLD